MNKENPLNNDKNSNKFDQLFKILISILYLMSVSSSKSKTQLAYARPTKPTNKTKSKNTSNIQTIENNKNRNPPRNSTGNIYDSIMGQIQPKQQDYIKSLIVKNQKEITKLQRHHPSHDHKETDLTLLNAKTQSKKSLNTSTIITGSTATTNTTPTLLKPSKEAQIPIKKHTKMGVHERTRSQAELLVKDSGMTTSAIETTKSIVHLPEEKQVTEISCNESQSQCIDEGVSSKGSIVRVFNKSNSKEMLYKLSQSAMGDSGMNGNPKELNRKDSNSNISSFNPSNFSSQSSQPIKNPIIEALSNNANTASSFAKKMEVFELEYPEEREERSTHKKVPSKLSAEYFSCQTSPKNSKHIYTKQIVMTTKPVNDYQANVRQQSVSANVSPISSAKNSNQKSNKKPFEIQEPTIATNFISCLDEYLEALTYNSSVSETIQENNMPAINNIKMKRSNSSKFKEFSASKGHPFTLGQEDEEEEEEDTVVIGNGPYITNTTSKMKIESNQAKLLSPSQQQKIMKELSQERKKVSELNSIIEIFQQQLGKFKRKEKKFMQNQLKMIEHMTFLNEELTIEREKRRKLQGVVNDFESKIRGISRGKQKARRNSLENEDRPERKTIYATSSMGNSIHFNHQKKNSSSKLEKHSKKPSFNRLSSMINSISYNNGHDDQSYEPYIDQRVMEQGFFKNKTQKLAKLISNFELENQPCDEEDEMYFRSRNFNQSIGRKTNNERQQLMRESHKKGSYHPASCKNSYMNSSMPLNTKSKSRPMTPKLVEELFRASNKSKNHEYQTRNYESSEESYEETSREYTKEHFDEDRDFESESEVKATEMSGDDCGGMEQQEYYQEVIKRMR